MKIGVVHISISLSLDINIILQNKEQFKCERSDKLAKSRSKTEYKNSRQIKKEGGQSEVLPIKDIRELNEFMNELLRRKEKAKTPVKQRQADRNWCMCLIGFNTAFRVEDLTQLKVKDVAKGYVHIIENKTKKIQNFRMNKQLHKDILDYIKRNELTGTDYLFRGQKTKQGGKRYVYPITRQHAWEIVSTVADTIGIDYPFGMHSLRKTFGYHYIKNGGNWQTLQKMYKHSDPQVTMVYIYWGTEDAEASREAVYIGGMHK